jgi:hypothetical protein
VEKLRATSKPSPERVLATTCQSDTCGARGAGGRVYRAYNAVKGRDPMRGRRALTAGLSAVLLGGGVLPITASPALAAGSIPLTALDTPYTQDFDHA